MAVAVSEVAVGRRPVWNKRARATANSLLAILLALVVGAIFISIAGASPLPAYRSLVSGAVGSKFAIGQTLIQAVPLLVIGLGLALAFRARVYNIGADGQFYLGALGAGAVAIELPVHFGPLLIAISLIAGAIAGGFWGWIVGFLRARWAVNVVISSLLLSYIATYIFTYVIRRPLRDPTASGLLGKGIPNAAQLPLVSGFGVHIGLFIALLLVPIVGYVMTRTPFGFRVRMLGLNPDAAQATGVNSGRLIIVLMVISGGLAGLAGAIQLAGVSDRLDPTLSNGYGFTAIVVALLGRLSATGVLLAALFLGALNAGGQAMSIDENVPYAVVLAIQGVFVIFLLVADRLARGR